MDVKIERYTKVNKLEWDSFVSSSKNGTFIFHRDFMEYHSDRFADLSLLFYNKQKLVAVLPANISGDIVFSHQGLTYGGLILSPKTTTVQVLNIFEELLSYLKQNGFSKLVYKPTPYIYHRIAAEEDLYALFRHNAYLVGRSISTCIYQNKKLKYSELRKRGIRKAQYENLKIEEKYSFASFWKILEVNLKQKYKVSPVHSLNEIEYLQSKFPQNIRLFEVSDSLNVLGGCVVFETDTVAHVQYISASEKGKAYGALDYLFDYLIQKEYSNKAFFEFGTSTEENGRVLNEGLIAQKEGFGGRAIVYDTYELII